MSEHERDDEREPGEPPEPAVDGGTGPGVSPGDVETPGAATTPNEPGLGADTEDED
jgi:hypothetical protein